MSPEITNMLITGGLILVLLVIFIWLLRALMPSATQEARRASRDDFDRSGYETMEQVRRKEFAVIGLGAFVILICVALVGGIIYMLWQSGFSATPEDLEGMNTLLVFIPAIAMLLMIVSASRRYVKHQQIVLREYRIFRSRRETAIKEYEGKRSGSDKEKKAVKKQPVRKINRPKRKGPPKLR
jgi:uncharacterized membrane protein